MSTVLRVPDEPVQYPPQPRARWPSVNDSGSSLGRVDPDVIRGQKFRIWKFGFDPYALETSFLLWHSEEDQEVLIVESLLESLQVGFEADQTGRSQGVAFTTGLFRDLRQPGQSHLQIPRASACTSNSGCIDRVNDDVVALADLTGPGRIGTNGRHAVVSGPITQGGAELSRCRFLSA